jgi:nucleotide-binding universal stress UspA family protein
MFRTILVPLSGMDSDRTSLGTALVLAKKSGAHLDCIHVRPDAVAIAMQMSTTDMGAPVVSGEVVDALMKQDKERAAAAEKTFNVFCAENGVTIDGAPQVRAQVTASWTAMKGDGVALVTARARYCDLTVAARPPQPLPLTVSALGSVAIGAGRPLLIAPQQGAETLGACVAIAWKETAEAARAVMATMPLLAKAKRVVILSVSETVDATTETMESMNRLAQSLRWHGLNPELRSIMAGGKPAADALVSAAVESGADVLAMGAYGHSRLRELVFGGVTQSVLRNAPLPVMMMH